MILSRAKDYYENEKKRLRKQARDNTETYLKKKRKKREYGKNRYHNVSEVKKIRLKEYQKNIVRQKSLNIIMNKIIF